jgi:two-component system chemotaxis response regulator CheY
MVSTSKTKIVTAKILIADDMRSLRDFIYGALQKYGFQDIYEAENGIDALERITKTVQNKDLFDLVISDIRMPGMDGIELLQNFRELEEYSETPFLICSTEAEKDLVMDAVDLGASGYLVKPFSEDALIDRILKLLKVS